jgi:hypothetical protein
MTTLRDVERRLAEEDATAELGVHLDQRGEKVLVHGQVSSEDARRAVLDRVGELLPGTEVVDQLNCSAERLAGPPPTPEQLR